MKCNLSDNLKRGDILQERTFKINAADMASLLMLLTAIEDIINSGGNVSDDVLEELEFVQPELERIVFDNM
ncbi:MAG: hypothetical protein ACI4XP_05555 [Acutalibacteraceae bacterium]